MSAALALQKAVRSRLTGTGSVTALVPASSILDRNQRPSPDPSIVLGEVQLVDEGTDFARRHVRAFHTIHVWKREPSLEGANAIMSAIQAAIHSARITLEAGYHCADCFVSSMRAMRDPDGETSHGVVTVEALIVEAGS